MREITKVYLVRGGESIKDGELEYSVGIESRQEAAADARLRVREDPCIRKIAYHRLIGPTVKILYSYDNPDSVPPCRPGRPVATVARANPVARPKSEPGLMDGLLGAIRGMAKRSGPAREVAAVAAVSGGEGAVDRPAQAVGAEDHGQSAVLPFEPLVRRPGQRDRAKTAVGNQG